LKVYINKKPRSRRTIYSKHSIYFSFENQVW